MNKKELLRVLTKKRFSNKIIKAFKEVNRKKFVRGELVKYSYEDIALPLQTGATISQPSTIAFMLELLELKGNENILEIGSGSGYVLALLSKITKGEIYGIEIIKKLAEQSKENLKKCKNVKVIHKDGSRGLKEKAPFDRILISASINRLPMNLCSQLKNHGILVVPVGESIYQIKNENKEITKKEFPGFVFVPLKKSKK